MRWAAASNLLKRLQISRKMSMAAVLIFKLELLMAVISSMTMPLMKSRICGRSELLVNLPKAVTKALIKFNLCLVAYPFIKGVISCFI